MFRFSLLVVLVFFVSSLNSFAQPANDNCFGAIPLTPGMTCIPVTGTVAGATQSLAGCTGTADDDVWYSFTANQTSLAVQVSGSAGFNAVVQVFSGGCASGSSMACSNNTGNGGSEVVPLNNLIVGVTYWVRVYHFAATVPTNPTFTICISPTAVMPSCGASTPAGNTCEQAVLICDVNGYCGSTAATYTSNSWPELSSAFCGSIENNSFIQFVANESTVSLNVWVTSSTSNQGIQIMVFSANNCSGAVTNHLCVSPLAPSPAAQPVTVSGLTPGNTYYMMIDGYAGDVCNYVIGVNSGILVSGSITTATTNVCLGTPVTLVAGGGNGIYDWTASPDLSSTTGSVVVATPSTPGQHTYTMTTNSSNPFCPSLSVSDITLNVSAPPTPNAGIDDTVCFGQQIFLTGSVTSTSNTIVWQFLATGISPTPTVSFSPNFSSLNPTVTVNQPGLYRFILRETNSVCGVFRDTMSVLVLNPQQTVSANTPSCFGLSDAEISITNPIASEYSFDGGTTWVTTSTQSGFASGTYSVCSRNYLGCTVCSDVEIINPTPLELSVSNDTLICQNGTAILSAQAAGGTSFTYNWDFTSDTGATQNVQPGVQTTYTVFAANEFGCQSEQEQIIVTVREAISGTISPNDEVCPGYSTNLTATATGGDNGPYNFAWNTGQLQVGYSSLISVNPSSTQEYIVTITDGCESTPLVLSNNVIVLPLPEPSVLINEPFLCEPANYTVLNTTDASLTEHLYWTVSNGQTFIDQESITTDDLDAGVYWVQLIVETPQGCIDSATFYNLLIVHPKPEANFTYNPNPVKMFSPEISLTNYSVNGVSYEWFIENGNPSFSTQENLVTNFPDGQTGSYEVTLITTSEFGCLDTMTKIVNVLPEIILYAPNTFTPDGDEFNQQWRIFIEGIDPYNFSLIMFNRWGEIIWETKDPSDYWDGTYNGELVQQGMYVWTIEAKDPNSDEKFNFQGHVNVLR
jgi:gliding motility-associated-like protein